MSIEQRKSARKILRINASYTVGDTGPLPASTMDIGKFGMSLINIRKPIEMGQQVRVAFGILSSGGLTDVDVTAKVAYCIPNDDEGYKVGLQFLDLASEGAVAIAQYIGN